MNVIESTIFYLVVLFICIIFARIAQKKDNKKYLFVPIILLTLVLGLRSVNTGLDTLGYRTYLEWWFNNDLSISRIGYKLLIKLVYGLWHNYNFFLIIEGFIINYLIIFRLWDFKKDISIDKCLFIFLITRFISILTINNQYLAIAIVFWATRYLNKSNLKFLILTVLAASIHSSGIIGIVYYIINLFINKKKLTKKNILFFILLLVGLIFAYFAIGEYYDKYFLTLNVDFGFMAFVQLLIYIVTSILIKNKSDLMKLSSKYYLVGIILMFLSYLIPPANRIGLYFMIFEPVYFTCILDNKKVSKAIKVIIIVWFILYSVYTYTSNSSFPNNYVYSFFFNL